MFLGLHLQIPIAFDCNTAKVVAAIVKGGIITSSPIPIPIASNAACIVAVPLVKDIACDTPIFAANSL